MKQRAYCQLTADTEELVLDEIDALPKVLHHHVSVVTVGAYKQEGHVLIASQ